MSRNTEAKMENRPEFKSQPYHFLLDFRGLSKLSKFQCSLWQSQTDTTWKFVYMSSCSVQKMRTCPIAVFNTQNPPVRIHFWHFTKGCKSEAVTTKCGCYKPTRLCSESEVLISSQNLSMFLITKRNSSIRRQNEWRRTVCVTPLLRLIRTKGS